MARPCKTPFINVNGCGAVVDVALRKSAAEAVALGSSTVAVTFAVYHITIDFKKCVDQAELKKAVNKLRSQHLAMSVVVPAVIEQKLCAPVDSL